MRFSQTPKAAAFRYADQTFFSVSFFTLLFFVTITFLLCQTQDCSAVQVSLQISTQVTVSQNQALATINVVNTGSEQARNLTMEASFDGTILDQVLTEQLDPGSASSTTFTLPLTPGKVGEYPLFFLLRYQHRENPSIFSAPALAIIRTDGAVSAPFSIQLTPDKTPLAEEIKLSLQNPDPDAHSLTVSCFAPEEITCTPAQKNLLPGQLETSFTISPGKALPASEYSLFFTLEYDKMDQHYLAHSSFRLTIPENYSPSQGYHLSKILKVISAALVLLALCLLLWPRFPSSANPAEAVRPTALTTMIDMLLLLAALLFILAQLPLALLITPTITTGGDTASHFYTLQYLSEQLLPQGRISGWTMGNYGGFPILQFYFPLPFLLMKMLALVTSLQVAFKFVTLLGSLILPVSIYLMLRIIRLPFPIPILGAVFALPFLFNPANSMWGGNMLSTLAGEFSYSLSMSLSFLLMGSLYRGIRENRWIIRNGILIFLVGFSHGYTLLFVEVMSIFLLISFTSPGQRFLYLLKVYGLGFLLLAFWLVPLLRFSPYTTPYHLVWIIHSWKEIVPTVLLPGVVFAVVGLLLRFLFKKKLTNNDQQNMLQAFDFFVFGLLAALVLFVAAPRLGVVDIRYLPYAQILCQILAAITAGGLYLWYKHLPLGRLLFGILAGLVLFWTQSHTGSVLPWSQWNYEGFEGKASWPLFQQINSSLAGSFQEPRVAYEHSPEHNIFGSSRAFESLPLFAGRATLEGLYMQASPSAPFVFYIQSLISHESSRPFPQYSYPTMDFARARPRLQLFNVRELIIRSTEAKTALRQTRGYSLKHTFGDYEIWQLGSAAFSYVTPAHNKPILYTGKNMKAAAFQWFRQDAFLSVPLLFAEKEFYDPALMASTLDSLPGKLPAVPVDDAVCQVQETILDEEILIDTDCINKPLLIKVSYHPNWRVEGAKNIYRTAPSFMLIYPEQSQVRLTYHSGPWETTGLLLTVLGVLILLLLIPLPSHKNQSLANGLWMHLCARIWPRCADISKSKPLSPSMRKIMTVVVGFAALLTLLLCYQGFFNEPSRIFQRSIMLKDSQRYPEARVGFQKVRGKLPLSAMAQQAAYYIAATYYLEGNEQQARKAFEEITAGFSDNPWVPAAHYHLGLILLRQTIPDPGIIQLNLAIKTGKGTVWEQYARDKLQNL